MEEPPATTGARDRTPQGPTGLRTGLVGPPFFGGMREGGSGGWAGLDRRPPEKEGGFVEGFRGA